MGIVTFGVTLIGGMVGAVVAHEVTHALAAMCLGAVGGRISLFPPEVQYEMPASASRWRDRVINLSPQLIGVAIAVAYVGLFGQPPMDQSSILLVAPWAVYTLLGGPEDFSMALADQDNGLQITKAEKQWLGTGLSYLAGLWIARGGVVWLWQLLGLESHRQELLLSYFTTDLATGFWIATAILAAMAAKSTDELPENHWLKTPVKEYLSNL